MGNCLGKRGTQAESGVYDPSTQTNTEQRPSKRSNQENSKPAAASSTASGAASSAHGADETKRTRTQSTTRKSITGTHSRSSGDAPPRTPLKTRSSIMLTKHNSEQEIETCESDLLREMGVLGRDKKTGNLKWNKSTVDAHDHCLSNWGKARASFLNVNRTVGTASGERRKLEQNSVSFSDDTTIGNPRATHTKRASARSSSSSNSANTVVEKVAKSDAHRFASPLVSLARSNNYNKCIKRRKGHAQKPSISDIFSKTAESPFFEHTESQRSKDNPKDSGSDEFEDNDQPGSAPRSHTRGSKPHPLRQVARGSSQLMVLGSMDTSSNPLDRLTKSHSDSRLSIEFSITSPVPPRISTNAMGHRTSDELEARRLSDEPFSLGGFGRRDSESRSESRSESQYERKEGEPRSAARKPRTQGRWSKTFRSKGLALSGISSDSISSASAVRSASIRRASVDSGTGVLSKIDLELRDSAIQDDFDEITSPMPAKNGKGTNGSSNRVPGMPSVQPGRKADCSNAYSHSRRTCGCFQSSNEETGSELGVSPTKGVRHVLGEE